MTSDHVDLVFPVDSLNREIDYRLFLAGMCAQESARVFIGQHDVAYRLVQLMRGGVYVGRNIFRKLFTEADNLSRYEALKRNGLSLVHLDEEGGVFAGARKQQWEAVLATLMDPRVLAEDDFMCTWGHFQESFYRALAPDRAENIRATGHPRLDLYKEPYKEYFAEDAARLRERFGDFILYNTTFAAALPKFGVPDWFSARQGYQAGTPESRDRNIAIWAGDTRLLSYAVPLINRLSWEFPDRTIVIRPHPSEDPTVYRAIFGSVPNVEVVHEGPVSAWLLACSAMIHSGCTTGIEAVLAETRTLFYQPVVDENADPLVAGFFGTPCVTPDDVVGELSRPEAEGNPNHALEHPEALDLIDNLRSDAFAALMGVVREAVDHQRGRQRRTPSRLRIVGVERRRAAAGQAKGLVRPLFPTRNATFQVFHSFFPGFERALIERKVAKVSDILGKPLRSTFYSDELFAVDLSP